MPQRHRARKAAASTDTATNYCSFCAKSEHEVRKLIAGPTVFICDECVDLSYGMVHDIPEPPSLKERLQQHREKKEKRVIRQEIGCCIITSQGGVRTVGITLGTDEARATHPLYPASARALAHSLRAMAEAVETEPKEKWPGEDPAKAFLRYIVEVSEGKTEWKHVDDAEISNKLQETKSP